jgi:hypothetical protein
MKQQRVNMGTFSANGGAFSKQEFFRPCFCRHETRIAFKKFEGFDAGAASLVV